MMVVFVMTQACYHTYLQSVASEEQRSWPTEASIQTFNSRQCFGPLPPLRHVSAHGLRVTATWTPRLDLSAEIHSYLEHLEFSLSESVSWVPIYSICFSQLSCFYFIHSFFS